MVMEALREAGDLLAKDGHPLARRGQRYLQGLIKRLTVTPPRTEPVQLEIDFSKPAPPPPRVRADGPPPSVAGFDPVGAAEVAANQAARPRTRADCVDGPRPCPWLGCHHHLALRVQPNGTILLNTGPDYRGTGKGRALNPRKVAGGAAEVTRLIAAAAALVHELPETCVLDVADRGEHNFVTISRLMRVDKERARQIAEEAYERAKTQDDVPLPDKD